MEVNCHLYKNLLQLLLSKNMLGLPQVWNYDTSLCRGVPPGIIYVPSKLGRMNEDLYII
jgi:hypothetical protein